MARPAVSDEVESFGNFTQVSNSAKTLATFTEEGWSPAGLLCVRFMGTDMSKK